MENTQVEIVEKKMRRIAIMMILSQGLMFLVAMALFSFQPPGYNRLGLGLSICALAVSFLMGRNYTFHWKQLGSIKRLSPEKEQKRNGELRLIFSPHGFWIMCIALFAMA